MAPTTTPDAPPDSGRDRIMDEAATLFLAHGYEGTSLRQLADVVGMKAGSLYYHFSSKDELLTEILRRGMDVMQIAFDDAQASTASGPARDRLEARVPEQRLQLGPGDHVRRVERDAGRPSRIHIEGEDEAGRPVVIEGS